MLLILWHLCHVGTVVENLREFKFFKFFSIFWLRTLIENFLGKQSLFCYISNLTLICLLISSLLHLPRLCLQLSNTSAGTSLALHIIYNQCLPINIIKFCLVNLQHIECRLVTESGCSVRHAVPPHSVRIPSWSAMNRQPCVSVRMGLNSMLLALSVSRTSTWPPPSSAALTKTVPSYQRVPVMLTQVYIRVGRYSYR